MMTADSDGSSLGIQILIIVLLTAINAFLQQRRLPLYRSIKER